MGAVWMCARGLMRRRVWGSVAVALLVGVAGTAVLAAWGGARRTDSAYPRLVEATDAPDVTVLGEGFGRVDPDEIAAIPGVTRATGLLGFGISSRPESGGPPADDDFSAYAIAPAAGWLRRELEPLLLRGRLPRPGRVDEIFINEIMARDLGLEPGDVYRASLYNFEELLGADDEFARLGREPTQSEVAQYFMPLDLEVVGTGRVRTDVLSNEGQDQAVVVLTPAFRHRYGDRASYELAEVHLRHQDRGSEFQAAVRRRFPDRHFPFIARDDELATFARAVSPYSDSLRLFALVAAATGLLVVAAALIRLVTADAAHGRALAALGETRAQRTGVSLMRATVVVCVGTLIAAVGVVASSPLFPLGVARQAEPDPGVQVDAAVLGLGLAGLLLVLLVTVGAVAWRLTRHVDGETARRWRPSRAAVRLAATGAGVSAVSGVRFAIQRDRDPASASPPTALFGLVVAIATIGAALVFATNLDRLVSTPERYGWTWDAILDTYDTGVTPELARDVRNDRDLAGVTTGTRATLLLDGRTVSAYGFAQVRGDALPTATEGRLPRAADEIALGAQTLHDLGRSVGDRVTAQTPDGTRRRMRIVGRTILPSLSLERAQGLGEGAAVTATALRALDPGATPTFFLLDLRPGVSVGEVDRRYGDISSALGPQRPADVTSYDRVRVTPLVLAGLLTLLGIGVLAHLLVTSVRARRRDLAILKTLGFTRGQVGRTVAWQATTLVLIALAVGMPTGVIAGRWVWRGFASDLGVVKTVVMPVLALVGIVVAGAVLANVIAAVPARIAARTKPALVLRSE